MNKNFFEKYLEKDEEILWCRQNRKFSMLCFPLCLLFIIELALAFLISLFLPKEEEPKFAVTNKRILIYENKQLRYIKIDWLKSAEAYEDISYRKNHNIKSIYLNFKDTEKVVPLNINADDYISARDAVNKAIENFNK